MIGKSGVDCCACVIFILAVGVGPVTILSGCGGGSSGEGGGSGSHAPFTVAAESSVSATQGSAFLLPVDLTRPPGFTDTVTVTLDNPPSGVQADTIVFSGTTTSALLPIRVTEQAAVGNHALSLAGKSPSASHMVPITLSVGAVQPMAQEKIEEALQAGTLDYGILLLYRAYARYLVTDGCRVSTKGLHSKKTMAYSRKFAKRWERSPRICKGSCSRLSCVLGIRPACGMPKHPQQPAWRPFISHLSLPSNCPVLRRRHRRHNVRLNQGVLGNGLRSGVLLAPCACGPNVRAGRTTIL